MKNLQKLATSDIENREQRLTAACGKLDDLVNYIRRFCMDDFSGVRELADRLEGCIHTDVEDKHHFGACFQNLLAESQTELDKRGC